MLSRLRLRFIRDGSDLTGIDAGNPLVFALGSVVNGDRSQLAARLASSHGV